MRFTLSPVKRQVCAALSALAITTTGVTAAGLTAPNTATATEGASPRHSAPPAITWEECPETVKDQRAKCGRISVPTYYSHPERGTISVGFVKVPAAHPERSRGAVFGNPGGPGGDAYDYIAGDTFSWPQSVRDEWDLIGVQPRGLKGSTPVKCDTPPNNFQPSDMVQEGAASRKLCEKGTPGYTRSLTTENTARDWEMVRKALDYDKISIVGLSYGTFLGSTYATLYPQRTDRLVLDSAMSPRLAWNGILNAQQRGYERALHDFFTYVARNNKRYHMGTTPLQAYQRWSDKVVRESGANPTVLPPAARVGDLPPQVQFLGKPGADAMTATGEGRVTVENLFRMATHPGANQVKSPTLALTRTYVPMAKEWGTLADHISGRKAIKDPTKDLSQSQLKEMGNDYLTFIMMQQMLMCNENIAPADPLKYGEYLWAANVTGDIFRAPNARYSSGAACAGSPAHVRPPKLNGAKLAIRPMQISGTGDPQTPYKYRHDMARSMGATVVTVHGPGHGHFAWGNKRVDEAVAQYLRTGKVPTTHIRGLH